MSKPIYEESEVVKHYLLCGKLSETREKFKTTVGRIKKTLKNNGIVVSLRKVSLNVDYFKKIDSDEKAYWLGFIASDGCIHKNKYKLSIQLKSTDKQVLLNFQKAINSGSPVTERGTFDKRTEKTYHSCSLQINSKEFCENIRNHGVDENKSKIFSFPAIEEKYYSHFVRGLYDGDGSIHIKSSPVKKRIWFKVNLISSQSCVGFIKNYLSKLGISTEKIFAKPAENIFYLNLGKDSSNFLKWVYKDSTPETRLERKYNKFVLNLNEFETQDRILTIYHKPTGETFKLTNLSEFCRKHGLSNGFMNQCFINKKNPKSGRHKDWEFIH